MIMALASNECDITVDVFEVGVWAVGKMVLRTTKVLECPPPLLNLGYSNAQGYTNSLKDTNLRFNNQLYVGPEVPIYTQFIGR
jgi:hypothetical protein